MKTMTTSLKLSCASFFAICGLAFGTSDTFAANESNNSGMIVFESTSEMANKLTIAGTSSLHDWEVVTEQIVGTVKIAADKGDLDTLEIKSNLPVAAQVTIPVKTLDSGKGSMDKKMFKALESDEHKKVTFVLESIEPADAEAVPLSEDGGVPVVAKGKLTVTGLTRNIDIPATIAWDLEKKSLIIHGKVDLRMTTFGIDPPTALFGTLKTGDEITVSFTWKPTIL